MTLSLFSSKMLSRAQKLRRYSTTKLWVKRNGAPCLKVSIKNCYNLDDFAEKVRYQLNARCQVSLHTSSDKDYLDPGLAMKDLIKSDELKNNSSQNPLMVKLRPVGPISKNIRSEHLNERGKFRGYFEFEIKNDADLHSAIMLSQGLVVIGDPDKVVVNFKEIQDQKTYRRFTF